MQDGSVFRDVDLLASKHGVDPRAQTAFFRQSEEQSEGFVGNAILRVVEVETHCLGGQAFAPLGVIRKELSEMQFPDLLIMRLESLPSRECGN
jgi:hypothetical protein